VSCIIRRLNDFIDKKIELDSHQVTNYLDNLIRYFTSTLHIPVQPGLKLLRARAFECEHYERDVAELSYIPEKYKSRVVLGRLNIDQEPIYYGCVYFNDIDGGVNVAFSEVDAKSGQTVNVLRSEVIAELNMYYIGIYDHIKRNSRPDFISEETFGYFKEVYSLQQSTYSNDAFLAHQLCDSFFADVLRRPKHGNLYYITSVISKLFMEVNNIDGIIYTSVKAEGRPVVAIKPISVEYKLKHERAECYRINYDYGYALYRASKTGNGIIDSGAVIWK
jgi:hypothetical protein